MLVLHGNHFRKDWQRRVKTWFNQPGRKLRRRANRSRKAAILGSKPISALRPVVHGQTVRYNMKLREGRGFTLAELKEAGVGRKQAKGLGIAVDHRRRNLSEEGKNLNVQRLKYYKDRLIVFPRNPGKPKKGDTSVRSYCLAIIALHVVNYFGAGCCGATGRNDQAVACIPIPPDFRTRTSPLDYRRGERIQRV
jgi:ribosomal protein L13E